MCDAVKAADRSRSTVRRTSCDPGCSAVRLPTETTGTPAATARSSERMLKVLTPEWASTMTASPELSG